MKSYANLISSRDPKPAYGYHYHVWTSQSIERFWAILSASPILRDQFYPASFWADLISWFLATAGAEPVTVLDVGCGSGTMIRCLSKALPHTHIIGVDISEDSLTSLRGRMPGSGRLELKLGALPHIPVPDASADLVICTEVLEHLAPQVFEESFREFGRIVQAEGYLLASLPIGQKMEMMPCPECGCVFTANQHQLFEITREDIRSRLGGSGFELVSFYDPIDHKLPPQWHRALLKQVMMSLAPRLAARLFFKAGVTGFLAMRT